MATGNVTVYVDGSVYNQYTISLANGAQYTITSHIPSMPSDYDYVSSYCWDSDLNLMPVPFTTTNQNYWIEYYFTYVEPPPPPWSGASSQVLGTLTISNSLSTTVNMSSMTLYRFQFYVDPDVDEFAIYSTGMTGSIGYLGGNGILDLYNGTPAEWDLDDSSSSGNFRIESVNDHTGYYRLTVRTYTGSAKNNVHIYVVPIVYTPKWYVSSQTNVGELGDHWDNLYCSASPQAVYQVQVRFTHAGLADFYITDGEYGTASNMYLGLASARGLDEDTGIPTHLLASTTNKTKLTYWCETGTTYYIYVRKQSISDSGYYGVNIDAPAGSTKVWFYHYLGDQTSETFDASYAPLTLGQTITLYDYRSTTPMFQGYRYNYATRQGSTTHIETATIQGSDVFNLHYILPSGQHSLTLYCNGNTKQVSITAEGKTTTSAEGGYAVQTITDGSHVVATYIGYNGSSTTWYEFRGWFSQAGGQGICYSTDRTYEFSMPQENRVMYGYAVKHTGSFQWTYAGLDSSGNPVAGTQKVSGYGFYLTAGEWNGLWNYIEGRLGHSVEHTQAYTGSQFTHQMYNEMIDALGQGSKVDWGDAVEADALNDLVAYAHNL